MAGKKKKGHGKKKSKTKKNPKRVAAGKKAYKKTGLYKLNMKRKKHSKGKKKGYGKKKGKHGKSKYQRYGAMKAAAKVNWARIAKYEQKKREGLARAAAAFAGPPTARHANTPYLRNLRKKYKASAKGKNGGGLPAWF